MIISNVIEKNEIEKEKTFIIIIKLDFVNQNSNTLACLMFIFTKSKNLKKLNKWKKYCRITCNMIERCSFSQSKKLIKFSYY